MELSTIFVELAAFVDIDLNNQRTNYLLTLFALHDFHALAMHEHRSEEQRTIEAHLGGAQSYQNCWLA